MNDIYFWIAQLLGLEALLLSIISYRKKGNNKTIMLQAVSSFCYVVHYLLLGAYSGFLICLLDFFRDVMYYKSTNDKLIFLFFTPFYIWIGILNYSKFIDSLPIIASINDGYIFTKYKKLILIGSIISSILWICYDLTYKSYSGALTSLIIIVSNISVLLFNKEITDMKSQINISKRK